MTIKKTILIILKLAATAGLVYFLLSKIEISNLYEAFLKSDKTLIILAAILMPLNIALQWYKWHYLVKLKYRDITLDETIKSFFFAFGIGTITPGKIGEFSKAMFIKNRSKKVITGLTFLERFFALSSLFFMGFLSYLYFTISNDKLRIIPTEILKTATGPWFLISLGMIIVAPIVIVITISRAKIFEKTVLRLKEFGNILTPKLPIIVFLNMTLVLTYIFQFYLIVNAFEPLMFVEGMAMLFIVMSVVSLLPFFAGNIGIREGSAVYFLGMLGINSSSAFTSGIILFVINLVIPFIAAAVLYLVKGSEGNSE